MGEAGLVIVEGVAVITFTGELTVQDLDRARETILSHSGFVRGMPCLCDVRPASLVKLTRADLARTAARAVDSDGRWGAHRTAAVVSTDVDFGIARMYEAIGARAGREFSVFRVYDEAIAWLRFLEREANAG